MSEDISRILADWPYDSQRASVRIIKGDDGRQRVQLRLDLGLLQMEIDGRPDGQKVEGFDSWLERYEDLQRSHDAAHPDGPPFVLESDDCGRLLREGVQYYHRYLSFWYLTRYEWCARDTARNLRLFTFVREYARHQHDRLHFDQWRPYVTMMHARAVATPLIDLGELDAAIKAIEHGVQSIEQFLQQYGQQAKADAVGELVFLKRWRRELLAKLDPDGSMAAETRAEADPIAQLQQKLDQAIGEERYEDAARLRDELSRLTDPPPPSTGLGESL